MSAADGLGPVQLLLVGFEPGAELKGEILAELERLSERDVVRVLDVLVVSKDADGRIAIVEASADGGVAAVLTGLHDEDVAPAPDHGIDPDHPDVLVVADEIPPGTTAAVALIEHRWAVGLRQAMQGAGGQLLAEAWLDPLELEAVGLG